MRIIAGRWRGHRIAAPPGHSTRPTSDRVREAIYSTVFSLLGDLGALEVVDLYAGSGALGLEALSRGAARCTFVESERAAAAVIVANLRTLGADPESGVVLTVRIGGAGMNRLAGVGASLLLADPPYRIDASEFSQVLEVLASDGVLVPGALVVYEHAADTRAIWPAGFEAESVKRYGDTAVSFATYEG